MSGDTSVPASITRRWQRDISDCYKSKDFKCVEDLNGKLLGETNTIYFKFTADDDIYGGQSHVISIKLVRMDGDMYPRVPPIVYFKTKIFHPNVSVENGAVCLNILQDKWSAANNLESIYTYIIGLMLDPNPSSPMNNEAARLFKDTKRFKERANDIYGNAQHKKYTEIFTSSPEDAAAV